MKVLYLIVGFVFLLAFADSCKASTDWEKSLAKGYNELAVGNTENAISIFQSKVKGHPNSSACHTALGRAYKRKGRIDDAKAEFRQATELEDVYPDAFYELGVVQESDKNWADAARAFERYLVLKPDASERRGLEDRITFCKSQK